jgi:hypothetical protein
VSFTPRIPCHVFTPDWIAEQKRKYAKQPEHARPKRYHFWTSEECQSSRDLIEQWIDPLSPESRQLLITRLRTPKHFEQTYNELAVGDSLRKMGHSVEYEVDLQGLTPDWFVSPTGTASSFVVEVVSSKPPQERARCDDGWEGLRLRFEELTGDAFLHLQPPFDVLGDEPVASPSGHRQKQMVQAVKKWLETAPSDGAELSIDGIAILLGGRNPDRDHVSCAIGCMPFRVDLDPLRKSVKEKAKKYRKVVQALQLPFVVCVIPDFDSGRGLDDLQSAVLGTERCRLWKGRTRLANPRP